MPPTTTSAHLSPAELSFLHTSLSSHPPIRPDSRLPTDFRPLNAEIGVLPNTMGSAHVGFADGREAVVGVRIEVEKTVKKQTQADEAEQDTEMQESDQTSFLRSRGRPEWVTLSLTLPGLRDDDKDLVFLEEVLREALVSPTQTITDTDAEGANSLQDALVINTRWHWHLYIDVLLISPPDASSSSSGAGGSSSSTSPLPLLSMAIHLALRDTRVPHLKSEGQEDPAADDDWEASVYLYSQRMNAHRRAPAAGLMRSGVTPPVTLLVMVVGENVIFDPSATELGVADGVWAISIGRSSTQPHSDQQQDPVKILGVRMLETPARDTMKGIPRDADPADPSNVLVQTAGFSLGAGTDQSIPGVWKPRVGGVKRGTVIKVLKAVLGTDGVGMGAEILGSLDGFLVSGS